MPNDTDLSELALLGTPALNFAFGDGADRYHTSHDDIAHLNKGSLQHHGQQALALARAFANGPLPRPRTGDAVFFDLPAVGLVVYCQNLAMPLALVAPALALIVIIRSRHGATRFGRDVILGAAATVGAVVLSVAAGYLTGLMLLLLHTRLPWGGAPAWSPLYWTAVALLSLSISTAWYVILRHRCSVGGAPLWSLGNLDSAFVVGCGDCARFELSRHLARVSRRAFSVTYGRSRPADSERYCHVPGGPRDGRAAYSNCIFDWR